jgi:hypothetical protein
MPDKRGVTIHFIDGTKVMLDFPKQTLNEVGANLKFKEVLVNRYMVFEADGAILAFPFENIKYIETHPAPSKLDAYVIRGATVVG